MFTPLSKKVQQIFLNPRNSTKLEWIILFLKSIQNQNILPYLPLNIKKYTDIEGKCMQNDM